MPAAGSNLLFKAIVLALCVVSFVHVFLFPLGGFGGGGGGRRGAARTLADLEQSLCVGNLRRGRTWRKARCPRDGVVTTVQRGRLGNQMWEYASVWAVARRTGLEPYIPRCIHLKLDQIFEQLTVPTFEEISHCPAESTTFAKSLDAWNSTNQSIILPRYSIQPELVLTWAQDILQEFTLRKRLREKSKQVLKNAVRGLPKKNRTFIGVHVRRTDYVAYLMRKHNARPAGAAFYRAAMAYFERKHRDAFFVVVSDDPPWCAKKFAHRPNVYVASRQKNSPALDLAIMAACDHSIYDYGTFGEWGAILAGGETVYYNLTHGSSDRIARVLKNWHTI